MIHEKENAPSSKRDVEPTLFQRWPIVCDAAPTLTHVLLDPDLYVLSLF